MIDTTELRRLRDRDTLSGNACLEFFVYACDNAHAIADELDALHGLVAELSSLDIRCKIAFAEMWEADHQGNSEKHFWYGVVAAAQDRYGRGERTEELLELMRQATRELTGKQPSC